MKALTLRVLPPARCSLLPATVWSCTFIAVACLLGATLVSPAACVPPPAGLVAWWPGEIDGMDIGGTNSGSLSGGVTFASGVAGRAFSFDGSSGQVFVPDSPSLRLTNQLTIEAWINTRSTSQNQTIVSKVGFAYGNKGYALDLLAPNFLRAYFNNPGQIWPGNVIEYHNPAAIVTQVWYHVAWTYDQSAMKLYLNGLPVATNVIGPQTISVSSSRLCISGVDENNSVRFNGLIDEPAVYNRALSDSEILAIYEAGSAGKCRQPLITMQPRNQVGYWGKNVTFSATVLGMPPLSYQWQHDNAPIAGATNPSLEITNLQGANVGNYTLIITNLYGTAVSSSAYLTVNPAGVSLALYPGITIEGVVGLTYGIQYNTDLNNPGNWRGAANVILGAPTQLWFDLQPAIQAQRYYRVVPGPISIP